MNKDVNIEESWKKALGAYFELESFKNLKEFIRNEYVRTKVFPSPKNIFKAFELTPLDNVKVVILGQDPYHGDGQAHGLSFSVPEGAEIPPSLRNIYKEIKNDIGILHNTTGNLDAWATQGVFLLNAILTVVAHTPASHRGHGWEEFTDEVIRVISRDQHHVVFMLWGNYARSKRTLIDTSKHLVLEAPHPSPLSAHSGFFGCQHFSKANLFLKDKKMSGVRW